MSALTWREKSIGGGETKMRKMEIMKATTHNENKCFKTHSDFAIDVFKFNSCIFIPCVGLHLLMYLYLEAAYQIDGNLIAFLSAALALYALFSFISLFFVGAQRGVLFLKSFYALNKIHFLAAIEILENPSIKVHNRTNECRAMRRVSRLSLRILGAWPNENTEPKRRSCGENPGREGSYVPSLPSEQR